MKRITIFLAFFSLLLGIIIINSCKKEVVIPTLTTSSVTDITINSATTGGSITKDGGATVTARGVCWGTTTSPDISGSHTSDNTGTGSFTSSLTALTPNTQYHVRAYATNKAGTAYGADVTFTTTPIVIPTLTTTAVTGMTLTTASSGGNITADGGGTITARGVCWAATANPVTGATNTTTDGTGTGVFTSAITGLLPGTPYHLRAYATNSAGTAYGADVTFTTVAVAVPTVTTAAITGLTLTTAISGGNVTADGGGAVTARGVCWATTLNPIVGATNTTSNSTGTGVFVSNITGLLPGTAYHVRAYATNSAGTAYGADVPFTTNPILVPTVTTDAITGLTLTTAISGGNVTADGGGLVTARGVCWGTALNPVIGATNTTSNGTGTGVFVSNITGLLPGTPYHVRAYATNSAGTAYGADVPFTTNPVVVPTLTTDAITGLTLTTAISGGNITADGGGAVTARGVCWGTALNPVIGATNTTSNGTGTGVFVSNITGLLPGTPYHVRAYATNSAGTAYGADVPFTTNPVVVPTVTTTGVTGITLTTANSGGNVTADGGGAVTARGVCWGITLNPVIGATNITTDASGTGVFTSNITGLLPGTSYHVRAYATNSAGTAYGADVPFTTNPVLVPTLTTTAVTGITMTAAASGGTITADGGGAVTARGVCWGTTLNPVIGATNITSDGIGTGAFTSNITGLLPGTPYHVRAYATNSAGTAYGADVPFTTNPVVVPTLTTTIVTSITMNTASSGGNITADGGGVVSARGVCWATTPLPDITDNITTNGTGTGPFTSALTVLSDGTNYYVRAYATNSAGTAYGNQQIFTTVHQIGTVSDNDGNTYATVKIGSQWWMAENLATTKYNTNFPITNITSNATWITENGTFGHNGAYCWYNNDAATYKNLYGALYNWYAVNSGNLCPTGWHVPTDAEYQTLELFLGMAPGTNAGQVGAFEDRGTDQGTQMKNTTGWAVGENGTNTSGFSALPGGYRFGVDGTFQSLNQVSYWWARDQVDATTAFYRRLDGPLATVYRMGVLKDAGKYVRCVK